MSVSLSNEWYKTTRQFLSLSQIYLRCSSVLSLTIWWFHSTHPSPQYNLLCTFLLFLRFLLLCANLKLEAKSTPHFPFGGNRSMEFTESYKQTGPCCFSPNARFIAVAVDYRLVIRETISFKVLFFLLPF